MFHRSAREATQPPAAQRHLDQEEDRHGQHEIERGTDFAPQAESPVIEQNHSDQRLQQVVGQRHPAGQRDRGETPAPTLIAYRPHDGGDVEDHDRDATEDVAGPRQDAPDRGVHRVRDDGAPDHERAAADQADAECPPLDAPNQRQVRSDVLEEAVPAEQQAEQHCREELDICSERAQLPWIRVEDEHRGRAAPGGVQEIAVTEAGVVRRDRLLSDSNNRLDVFRCRSHDPDRASDGWIQEAEDDEGDDGAVRQPVKQQQKQSEQRIHVQDVAGPEYARVHQAEDEQPEQPSQIDACRALRLALLQASELDREADGEQHAEHTVELAGEDDVADHFRAAVPPVRPHRRVEAEEQRRVEGRHVHDEDAEQGEAADRIEHLDAFAGRDRSGVVGHAPYTRSRPASLSS